MKKVKFANFDNIENVINGVVGEFPSAKVECIFGINGNGLGIVMDTNETTYHVNINIADKTVEEGIDIQDGSNSVVPCVFKISTVKKLPGIEDAEEKTLYILSAKDGERVAGTVWEKVNGEFVSKTNIGAIGE